MNTSGGLAATIGRKSMKAKGKPKKMPMPPMRGAMPAGMPGAMPPMPGKKKPKKK